MLTLTTLNAFLQSEIEDYNPEDFRITLQAASVNGLLDIHYHTPYHNDYGTTHGALPIFHLLSRPEYAGQLHSISLSAEDEGFNGTQNWDLINFLQEDAHYENLATFSLPLNEADTHNRKIVTMDDSYDENGGLGLLLDKCPRLQTLVAPSAPDARFFKRETHGLITLHLQTGYHLQGFITNLSQSSCFPALAEFVFRDYAETYTEDYAAQCVPFADYLQLLRAQGLPSLRRIVLLDTILTAQQQAELIGVAKEHGRTLEFGKVK